MVRISSAARPTADDRFLATGWSSRRLRYSSGISPETRERRNTSSSGRYSWAACARHRLAALSRTVSSTSPGLAPARPSAARISRLAADCSRASRNARCSSAVARDVRVVRSLRSPTIPSPGLSKSGPICRAEQRNGRDSCFHLWEFRAGPSKSHCASGWTPAGPRVALHEAVGGVRAPASIGCAIKKLRSQRTVETTTKKKKKKKKKRFKASVRHDGGEELGHLVSGSAGHRKEGFVADLVDAISINERQALPPAAELRFAPPSSGWPL